MDMPEIQCWEKHKTTKSLAWQNRDGARTKLPMFDIYNQNFLKTFCGCMCDIIAMKLILKENFQNQFKFFFRVAPTIWNDCNMWLQNNLILMSTVTPAVHCRHNQSLQCLSQEWGIFQNCSYQFFFYSSQKKKYSYLWGGFCGGNFEIYHANQQFSTCMLIDTHVCKQTRKIHDQSSTRLRMLLYAHMFVNANKNTNWKYTKYSWK